MATFGVWLWTTPSGTVPGWVMVYADSFVAASRAADRVRVRWNSGDAARVSEADLQRRAAELIAEPGAGAIVVNDPGVEVAFAVARKKIERTYTTSTVMHFALEPINALAFERNGVFEIHTGNQWQTLILPVLAKALGRSQNAIVLRSYLLGGGFGRRLDGDYAVPAALAAKAVAKPVKMTCTREDDSRFDCPRSPSVQVLRMAFGDNGGVIAMDHQAAAGWRTPQERELALRTVAPVWYGNEVWLVAAAGTLYFAFPLLYASAFSGFYLPLMIVLWLLILRGIGIELRSHFELGIWRDFFDTIFSVGSGLLAFFFGVALANVIRGVPLQVDHSFFLPLWTNFHPGQRPGILDWYTVLGGMLALAALAEHGALYLAIKTEGVFQQRARHIAKRLWPPLAGLTALSLAATIIVHPRSTASYLRDPVGFFFPAAVAAGLGMMFAFSLRERDDKAFAGSTIYLAAMMLGAAFALNPVVMPSTLGSARDLTVVNTHAAYYGLSVGLIWWGAGIGIAIANFIFVYWMFRGRVQAAPPHGPMPVGRNGHG
jgi:cytochrome d ubiquinol oxidase subunit II